MVRYDPLDSISCDLGWSHRDEILNKLDELKSIDNPTDGFQVVLTDQDHRWLSGTLSRTLSQISEEVLQGNFVGAAQTSTHLMKLKQANLMNAEVKAEMEENISKCLHGFILSLSVR